MDPWSNNSNIADDITKPPLDYIGDPHAEGTVSIFDTSTADNTPESSGTNSATNRPEVLAKFRNTSNSSSNLVTFGTADPSTKNNTTESVPSTKTGYNMEAQNNHTVLNNPAVKSQQVLDFMKGYTTIQNNATQPPNPCSLDNAAMHKAIRDNLNVGNLETISNMLSSYQNQNIALLNTLVSMISKCQESNNYLLNTVTVLQSRCKELESRNNFANLNLGNCIDKLAKLEDRVSSLESFIKE